MTKARDAQLENDHFLGGLTEVEGAILVRLRADRVLFSEPDAYRRRGRPRKHGECFAFREPDTGSLPKVTVTLEIEDWGQVRLHRWDSLHAKQDARVVFSVPCCEVHREREKPPQPLWRAYRPSPQRDFDRVTSRRWFPRRWPLEPAIRLRKEALHWDKPRLQQVERWERWTALVEIAN